MLKDALEDEIKAPGEYRDIIHHMSWSGLPESVSEIMIKTLYDIVSDEELHRERISEMLDVIELECQQKH